MRLVRRCVGVVLDGPLDVLDAGGAAPGLAQRLLGHLLALHLHGLERDHLLLVSLQLLLLQLPFLLELHALQRGVGPDLPIQFTFQGPFVLGLLDFVLRPRRLRQLRKIVCTCGFNKRIAISSTPLLVPFHLLPDEFLVLPAQPPTLRDVVPLLLQAPVDVSFPLLSFFDRFDSLPLHLSNMALQRLLISPLLPSLRARLELFAGPACHGAFRVVRMACCGWGAHVLRVHSTPNFVLIKGVPRVFLRDHRHDLSSPAATWLRRCSCRRGVH
mmetsp:Transcript_57872/g.154637  ORF Transcript_57872/g.154637 Transcript_57872/m.154637 type:complete len:271 (-) Transcript_57872:737-1549(-)